MFEYMSIVISSVSVLAALINLIVSVRYNQHIRHVSLEEKHKNKTMIKNSKITNESEVKKLLSHLSEFIKKLYPLAPTKISIHILKKNTLKIEDSIVEQWISYPSAAEYEYIVKNNTDFNSLLVENNKYFFVSDLSEFESLSNYINENPKYTNCQTTITFPIKNNKSINSEIIGFLCVASPDKFNNVKNNKK